MKASRALILLAAAWPALAQLQLYTVDGKVLHHVSDSYDFGLVELGSSKSEPFALMNPGPASVILTALSVGQNYSGFSLLNPPQLPVTLVAGSCIGCPPDSPLTVRFQPTATNKGSATLLYNSTSVLLLGTGQPGPTILSNGVKLSSGDAVDFGSIYQGATTSRGFSIQNQASASLTINTVALSSGSGFTLVPGLSLPQTLAPQQSVSFTVQWAPQTVGPATGALSVDGIQFNLTGTATAPPLPQPKIAVSQSSLACAQQAQVSIQLASPSLANGTGQLAISFSGPSDPAVAFLPSGTTVPFSIQTGDTQVHFGSASTVTFQTGTTAGTITLKATLGALTDQTTIALAPTAVEIDSAVGQWATGWVTLTVNGYDNTRTAGPLAFTFKDKNGAVIGGSAIHADATTAFQQYFPSAKAGGVFTLKATFAVTGDASLIDSVDFQLANTSGTATKHVTITQ